jgi:undecaprenyl-diphosphatase
VAAGLLEATALVGDGSIGVGLGVITLGVVTSFVAGFAAIWFLVRYLERRTLLVFVAYRVVLGLLLLWLERG